MTGPTDRELEEIFGHDAEDGWGEQHLSAAALAAIIMRFLRMRNMGALTMTPEQRASLKEVSATMIEECRDKHLLDPRDPQVSQDYHVELTFSVGEVSRYVMAANGITG